MSARVAPTTGTPRNACTIAFISMLIGLVTCPLAPVIRDAAFADACVYDCVAPSAADACASAINGPARPFSIHPATAPSGPPT